MTILNEQKTVFGVNIPSLVIFSVVSIELDGTIKASPLVAVDAQAVANRDFITAPFDYVEKEVIYDQNGLPTDETIDTPVKKPLSEIVVTAGVLADENQNVVDMVRTAIIDELVRLEFISDINNVSIGG